VYGKATVFGDEADRANYAKAKAAGLSDAQARQLGDNGQGAKNLGGVYTPDTYGGSDSARSASRAIWQ